MSKKQQQREELVRTIAERHGKEALLNRNEIISIADALGHPFPHFLINKNNRAGRSTYRFSVALASSSQKSSKTPQGNVVPQPMAVVPINKNVALASSMSVESNSFTDNLIPSKDPLFVPFGNYSIIQDIIKSKMFYPVFVTGLSGNGKTHMVEQACAATKREVIRVNFTIETDEDDLIGGFRMINGETKFFKGPVIRAMELGAVLLCDEIDLANPAKVMCLQSILEGSGYFIKKTGEYITPAEGFTVIATANTKGKGSESGQFIGTNILNEAFLERFPVTCEQEYPSVSIEKKILNKLFAELNITDTAFIDKLVDWADIIRKTYFDEGVDEVISTRRLVHISRAYAIFNDRAKAIELCINRFDEETKLAFSDLYSKVDGDVATSSDSDEDTVVG